MLLEYVPLGLVGAVWLVVLLAPYHDRLSRPVNRSALRIFGPYARARVSENRQQVEDLRAAHIGTTYRVYASKTFLYASLAAFTGSILGAYGIVALYRFLRFANENLTTTLPPRIVELIAGGPPELSLLELFAVFLGSSATLGVVAGLATYQFRWSLPSYLAGERARRIDVSLERNVAFMYALSRSGMSFAEILRIISDNQDVYGETAAELSVAVKDIDLYGTDIVRALERLSRRTPSEDLAEFADNLASVMQSGQSLPAFLNTEYEYFADEAEAKQDQFLELLATLAEAYVTILVAGPLFLITILVIIGLVIGGTLTFLQLLGYLVLPLATLGFVTYLDSITDPSGVGTSREKAPGEPPRFGDVEVRESSTESAESRIENRYNLALSKRLQPILRTLRNPLQKILERPQTVFYGTVPLAVVYLIVSWAPLLTDRVTDLAAYDDPLIRAGLFLLGTFAVFHEIQRRRIKAIEASVPDFLDRLASTNEAGMPVVESFGRVVRSDLGPLTAELERTWADVRWGAHVEVALQRFRERLATPAVTRVIALTTNAMSASGDIGPVLRIAANDAKATQRLERDRRNEMVTYLVVIYLSFLVFLTIIVALEVIFIPQIPNELVGGGLTGGTAGVPPTEPTGASGSTVGKDDYSLVFFHTALVQAVCSGLVAGQMGENSIEAGAKHSFAMLAIAYGLFLVLA